MVYGVWCMVYGVWCMVYGVWCMVYDVQCMVQYLSELGFGVQEVSGTLARSAWVKGMGFRNLGLRSGREKF